MKQRVRNNRTIQTQKKVNLDLDPIACIKINSKWIINLNVKHKTIKLLEKQTNIGEESLEFGAEQSSEPGHRKHSP